MSVSCPIHHVFEQTAAKFIRVMELSYEAAPRSQKGNSQLTILLWRAAWQPFGLGALSTHRLHDGGP
jgi:hypothetical protein